MGVLVAHIELQKPIHGFERFTFINLIPLGTISVTLFFVLSGFLITFLILQERQQHKSFDLKKFYTRRALRIWPLYFLVIAGAFVIYGKLLSTSTLLLIIFFLPTVAIIQHKLPTMLEPIWSIGIEEQFYLFFPVLFKLDSLKIVFRLLIGLLIGLQLLKYIAIYFKGQNRYWHFTADYLYYARFDCMILGALAAFIYFNNFHQQFMNVISLNAIYSKTCQYIIYLLLALYMTGIFFINLPVVHVVLGVLFTIALLNLGTNEKSIISFKSQWLKKIGIVSYGLYIIDCKAMY